MLIKGSATPYYISNDPEASAREFVKVLSQFPLNPTKTKIIVIDLNDRHELNNFFITSVDSLLSTPAYRILKNSVITLDVSWVLSRKDYYILDAHLKPSGHEKVATMLVKFIK